MSQFFELGQGPEPVGPQKPLFGDDKTLIRAAVIIGTVIALWKLYVALTANVIWEEGHFAVSGLYPALGYPDIPAGFPLLSRLITLVFGMEVVPLRLVSLLLASLIPPAIYFMATPVVSKRQAIWAAIISMLIPPLSISGTIFYPEGLLQLLLALMLGCLLRALATDLWRWWALAGVCAALGLFVHFRFLIPGAGVLLFCAATPEGRKLWGNLKFWSVGLIAALGLVPSILYNAFNDWPAVAFHVTNRPDWRPDLSFMVSFLSQQIGMVTPLFFVALVLAGKQMVWDDRHKPIALLGMVGAFIFGLYFLQSPANRQLMPHWPFMAYVPLVVAVPGLLIGWADAADSARQRKVRSFLIGLAPALAFAVGVGITVYQFAWSQTETLSYKWRALNFMQNEDWSPVKPAIDRTRVTAVQRFGEPVAVAVSGHVPAVRLEFPDDAQRAFFTLDEPYDSFSRFGTARKAWGLSAADLVATQSGKGVVLVLPEPSYIYHQPEEVAFRDDLCQRFDAIEASELLSLPPGRTVVGLYSARVRAVPIKPLTATPCPLLPSLYIAQPPRGTFITADDATNFFGIAVDPIGLTRVEILIDGKAVTEARYGLDPEGFRAPPQLGYDPNWPKVQFDFKLNGAQLKSGEHRLSLRATRTDGTTVVGAERTIYVK